MTKIEIFALIFSCSAVCIAYSIIISVILYKRIDSAVRLLSEDLSVEQTCRIDNDNVIRDMLKESRVNIDELDVSHSKRIDELNKALNDERQLRIKRNAELLDSVDQQFKQISFQSGRIDDLDRKFNDVLIAKSVEHPETFRSRAAEGRCVFCGKKVDPVFIMPLMINTKALTYANGQELYTCEECYKKFDQFIAGRRA